MAESDGEKHLQLKSPATTRPAGHARASCPRKEQAELKTPDGEGAVADHVWRSAMVRAANTKKKTIGTAGEQEKPQRKPAAKTAGHFGQRRP